MDKITNNIPFMNEMFEKMNIRKDALEYFTRVEKKISENPEVSAAITDTAYESMTSEPINFDKCLAAAEEIAPKLGEHVYTVRFILEMRCLPYLREFYAETPDLTEEMFWGCALDMRCKLNECIEMTGIYGEDVGGWFREFFNMGRFVLGRFQYEPKKYEAATFKTPHGHVIEQGSDIFNFHIPSSGIPLTDDVRNDSYLKAWEFFKNRTGSNRIILRCTSWLLYPEHYRFLPQNSNILRFMDDFDLQFYSHKPVFKDSWRLFGKSSKLPLEQWDEKTSLQRAYKKRLLEGKPSGDAMGFIIMENGVNITKTFPSNT